MLGGFVCNEFEERLYSANAIATMKMTPRTKPAITGAVVPLPLKHVLVICRYSLAFGYCINLSISAVICLSRSSILICWTIFRSRVCLDVAVLVDVEFYCALCINPFFAVLTPDRTGTLIFRGLAAIYCLDLKIRIYTARKLTVTQWLQLLPANLERRRSSSLEKRSP
jgi:hypothetical protein